MDRRANKKRDLSHRTIGQQFYSASHRLPCKISRSAKERIDINGADGDSCQNQETVYACGNEPSPALRKVKRMFTFNLTRRLEREADLMGDMVVRSVVAKALTADAG